MIDQNHNVRSSKSVRSILSFVFKDTGVWYHSCTVTISINTHFHRKCIDSKSHQQNNNNNTIFL